MIKTTAHLNSYKWLEKNFDKYFGKWVALKKGELIDIDETKENLEKRIELSKEILIAKCGANPLRS